MTECEIKKKYIYFFGYLNHNYLNTSTVNFYYYEY